MSSRAHRDDLAERAWRRPYRHWTITAGTAVGGTRWPELSPVASTTDPRRRRWCHRTSRCHRRHRGHIRWHCCRHRWRSSRSGSSCRCPWRRCSGAVIEPLVPPMPCRSPELLTCLGEDAACASGSTGTAVVARAAGTTDAGSAGGRAGRGGRETCSRHQHRRSARCCRYRRRRPRRHRWPRHVHRPGAST